ncbi:MAG: ABC transporter ATP-binding protein, partial [Protaetiibacter sp.]
MSRVGGAAPVALVDGLTVRVGATGRTVLDEVSLELTPGTITGLAGETGSGKSTLGLALLGFLAPGLELGGGRVVAAGHDVFTARPDELRMLRGRTVASVPQDPASALNPGLRISEGFAELLAAHGVRGRDEQRTRRAQMFAAVGLPAGEAFARRYPHQVSGGQLQRVAIAMAFALEPSLVVMDEPTTGLDVSTTARVAELVRALSRDREASVVFISHDLRLLLGIADRVAIMQGGRIVEEGPPRAVVADPRHPYTRRLLAALPAGRTAARAGAPGDDP